MPPKSTPDQAAGQPPTDLELERLPNGELVWLRSTGHAEPDDAQYVVTDRGRRALAMEALFGPWPTVAVEASRS